MQRLKTTLVLGKKEFVSTLCHVHVLGIAQCWHFGRFPELMAMGLKIFTDKLGIGRINKKY